MTRLQQKTNTYILSVFNENAKVMLFYFDDKDAITGQTKNDDSNLGRNRVFGYSFLNCAFTVGSKL